MATSGFSMQSVTMTFPRPILTHRVTYDESMSLSHPYSDRYMLTYLITFRLPSTTGVTSVRGVFHPAYLSGKVVLTRIENQGKVLCMGSS